MSPHHGESQVTNHGIPITNHQSPITRLHALSISRGVYDYLSAPHAGRILATFSRSCYLDLEERIVALVSRELLNGPLNVVISLPQRVTFDRVTVGAEVNSAQDRISVEGGLEISLEGAKRWDARLRRWQSNDDDVLANNLTVLRTILLSEAPKESFARQLPAPDHGSSESLDRSRNRRATDAMTRLQAGLRNVDPVAVADATQRLAGLGPGLTPSGDDVLVGTLLALIVRPSEQTEPLPRAIMASAAGRTTRISMAYLEAAARGEASETWHRLIAALPENDHTQLLTAARRVIAFGETSGADMLAGFLLAIDALPNSPQ